MKLNIENYCLPILFLLGRLILILSLPYEGLVGYGDLTHYYRVAALGTPMIDVWIEYPPIFAFISRGLYLLFSGTESSFVHSLVILFCIAQAVSLFVFNKLFTFIYPQTTNNIIPIIYFTLLCFIPFGWWQFDSLAVLAMLLGMLYFLKKQDGWASIYTVLGILLKIFPIFLVPMVIKTRSFWRNLLLVCLILGCVAIVMGGLYLISPQMTSASWIAQMSKGSWETVWALIDGNMTTGSFGPLVDRFTPESAAESMGNPARIDPRLSLVLFTFVGLILFVKYPCVDNQSRVAFLTITWCIFLLWSPGWSPQWILYLIPLIFLSMPDRTGILLVVILTLVNLLEWPLLLSRGDIWGLWLTVPLRTFLIILTLILLLKVRPGRQSSEGAS